GITLNKSSATLKISGSTKENCYLTATVNPGDATNKKVNWSSSNTAVATVTDGKVTDYGCANFEDPAKGRDLIESEILSHHKTLPIGEFAIGTNTTAYRMARTYGIEDRLPILIAEKTGPHLALGDTCYSHEEDNRVYNPDGKEIVAKDNECSLNRKSKDEETKLSAYFQCHTDITIPFDELGLLCGIRADGSEVKILENGRFVLAGCDMLNEQLDA
ncbi:MAG: Ig-like domain-containing protein, partial [Lachnospiraceae bacterium]|nr:Ig-like domain-containing protein [Lachnospiraceae bacterium]